MACRGIRYIEADARTDESDDEWETVPGTEAGSDEESRPTTSKRAKSRPGDASLLLDGEGKAVRVMGLSSYQRATFLKLLMLHGYGDGTCIFPFCFRYASFPLLTAVLRQGRGRTFLGVRWVI